MNNWGLVVDNWCLVVDWGSVVRGGLMSLVGVSGMEVVMRGIVVHVVMNWDVLVVRV